MVDKKPTSDTWPGVSGDYIVGDPESPVAVVTLAYTMKMLVQLLVQQFLVLVKQKT